MCGIISAIINNPNHIKRNIIDIYHNQQYRGKSGFGIAIKHIDGEIKRVRTKFEHEIFKEPLWDEIEKDDLVLFHHRIPTSSPNLPSCNHPLTNSTQSLYLIHNGIITGYDDLVNREFESKIKVDGTPKFGWKNYDEFTDSELCVHRMDDLLLKNDMIDSVKILGEENYFSAFLMLQSDEHKIFFTSNSADLNYYEFGGNKFISSLPYIKTFREIDNTYGWISKEENVIRELETSRYPTYLPQYCGKDYGFYDDSASEESCLFDRKREIMDSHLFTRFKQEHGCCDICEKCDLLDDCLDLFKEWRQQEFENDFS